MVPKKTKGRPKGSTRGVGLQLSVRLHDDLLTPLDDWISAQPDPKPSRPEAVRFALRDWLIGIGKIKPGRD